MKFGKNSLLNYHSKFPLSKRILLILSFLILGFLLVNFLKPTPEAKLANLPQDPAIQVYFNHNPVATYEDPYRHFPRNGDNLEQQIVSIINQAQSTVDLAVMQLRLPKVAEALVAKHQKGVKVRILIDNKYNKTLTDYTPAEITGMNQHDKRSYEELKRYPADALGILRTSGIEIKDDTGNGQTKGSGLMHDKFLIVDGKNTVISSANFTNSDMHGRFDNYESRGNPNNLVIVPNNTDVAKVFTDEFNLMWEGLFKSHKPYRPPLTIPVGSGTLMINFSPATKQQVIENTSNGAIAYYLQQAKKSIHMALFVFSDQKISDTLSMVRDRGVEDIKLLIDPDFFGRPYSKAYDAMGLCPSSGKKKRASKVKVKPWLHPITTVGFPVPIVGDRGVHSKMAILDETLVIAGSHNWTSAANYLNDETLIAIQNPTVAAHYEREFNRLYQRAQVGIKSLHHAQKCQRASDSPQDTQTTESESDNSV